MGSSVSHHIPTKNIMKVFITISALLVAAHAAPQYHAAPVYHAAPAYHAPVVHAAPAYPDVPSPYTYSYAVADDYSKSNFNAAETGDGAGNAEGSYSVALP